jgi:hypothetical protein
VGAEKIVKFDKKKGTTTTTTVSQEAGTEEVTTTVDAHRTYDLSNTALTAYKLKKGLTPLTIIETRDCSKHTGTLEIRDGETSKTLIFGAMGAPIIREVDRNVFVIANRKRLEQTAFSFMAFALAYAPYGVLNFYSSETSDN